MFSRKGLGPRMYQELYFLPQPIEALGLDLQKGVFKDKQNGKDYKISSINTSNKKVILCSEDANLEITLKGNSLSSTIKIK